MISRQWFGDEQGPIRWVYFGKDPLSEVRLRKNIDSRFSEIDIARSLDQTADKIRAEHVAWIDAINRKYGGKIGWWFGNVSSRNIYSSDLFLYCCYLVLLEQLWQNPVRRPALIIVDSPGLASAICRWSKDINIHVSVKGHRKKISRKMFSISRFGLRWLGFIISTGMRKLASVTVGSKNIAEKPKDVLVSTFVHDSSVSDEGIFKDRYFPGLYEYLENNKKTVVVHPVFHGFRYNFFQIFRKISKSPTDFIIQEKYLKLSDYLSAWSYPVCILTPKIQVPHFHGFNLDDIVREDQINGDLQNTLQAYLTFYLMERLKAKGLNVRSLIRWYENQALDRGIVAGVRKAFPETKIIGAQVFLHYPNFLSLFPSRSEVDAGMVPDVLLATSPYQCKLAKMFVPNIHCTPAAALRYAHVFSKEGSQKPFPRRVLVLTSGIRDETLELLILTQEIAQHLGDDTDIHVQLHADIRIEEVQNLVPEILADSRIQIVQGSFAKELSEASVVISKSSGSLVEAIAKGIPGIFAGNRNKLNLNPMAGISTPLLTECYSADEAGKAVQYYLEAPETARQKYPEWGRAIRDQFFLPVNDETLAPFLMS